MSFIKLGSRVRHKKSGQVGVVSVHSMWDDQYSAFGVTFYNRPKPVDKAGFHLIDRFDEWELVEVGHRKTSLADERKLLGLMPIEINLIKTGTSMPRPPSDIFYWGIDSYQYRLRSKFYEVVADPYNPSFALRVQAVRDQIDDLIAKYDISKSDIF
tara:strand:+ start:274 stop:741 length:468 start_codon:yes stop_codon:yes gene_type:complete